MNRRQTEIKPSKKFEDALAQCTPEDFDGHTEFHRLTPEQRLDWLFQAATFVHEFKGRALRAEESREAEAGIQTVQLRAAPDAKPTSPRDAADS